MAIESDNRSRVPGPLGTNIVGAGVRSRGGLPGPVGLNVWSAPIFAAPGAVAKVANTGSGGRALIVVGTGHDDLKKDVRYPDDKHFNQAILDFFAPHTKGLTVTIKHVNSAKEMKRIVADGPWEVVAYFGHGVVNQMALEPKEGGARLSKDELVAALKQAKPSKVLLMGCKAGWTGLGRQISKEIPGVTVGATFESRDVSWEQGKPKDGDFYNRLTPSEDFTMYKDGFQLDKGQKAKKRRREQGDKIDMNSDPFDDTIDQ